MATRPEGIFFGIGFMILMAGMFSPFVLVGLYDFTTIEQWKALPTTPISAVQAGQYVKIEGGMNSTGLIALGYHEVETKYGYDAVWNSTDSFRIQDGTGSIRVDYSNYYWIRDSGYKEQISPHVAGPVYERWHPVVAIGDVRSVNGEKVFFLKYLASRGTVLDSNPIGLIPAIVIIPLFTVLSIWVWRLLAGRKKLHEEKVQNARPIPLPADRAVRDETLPWIPNSQPMNWNLKLTILVVWTVIAASITYYLLQWASFRRDTIWMGDFMVGIFPTLAVVLPFSLIIDRSARPAAVAIGQKGIHFWYDGPEWRMLYDNFVGWDEINYVGEVGAGKSKFWAIEQKDHILVRLGSLDQKLIKSIVAAWKTRSGEPAIPPNTPSQIYEGDASQKK
jgi:hypothetical protein